jgi:hypothetical protein
MMKMTMGMIGGSADLVATSATSERGGAPERDV